MSSTVLSTGCSKGACLPTHVCCLTAHVSTLPNSDLVYKVFDSLGLHLGCFSRSLGSLDLEDKLFHLGIHD